ncbi:MULTISPECIES: sensor histidine kinase [Alphaproteobacteria]|jgi:PAS domain S-box-containing protein|uniref:histidine kinase n=1 Tax=Roseivivax sediminis TaxID=936889 RepID=A0A1I2DNP9_9RHOB|nr:MULTISPECIES: PAS domain S-box protein [Alphaproteobacteria]MCA1334902.1 PAS domain S-box protein [Pseudooceanicola marinus]SFE82001.1 PAS domain S-box-containing protein [Roseivivax sediminis]
MTMTQSVFSELEAPESLQQHLAAIVEGSDDAIITKGLDSVIRSWNPGAERLFGYSAQEAIGRPITLIFPDDRMDEEAGFIARLSRGERISNLETIRKRKDGSLVPISLTVSPVRNADGKIIGASKIARDITLQRQAAERQQLLLSEMRHRVGNSFAVASGLLSIAARQADSVQELVTVMRQRLLALASVHARAVDDPAGARPEGTALAQLINSILEPFSGGASVTLDVPELKVCPAAITPLSLVIFELATNAVKYGGLSEAGHGIAIYAHEHDDRLIVQWTEDCATKPASGEPGHEGFGTRMCQSTVGSSLAGRFSRDFSPDGMSATLDLDLRAVTGLQT